MHLHRESCVDRLASRDLRQEFSVEILMSRDVPASRQLNNHDLFYDQCCMIFMCLHVFDVII